MFLRFISKRKFTDVFEVTSKGKLTDAFAAFSRIIFLYNIKH